MVRAVGVGLVLACASCGAQANDLQDPKPADSVDQPPNTITDGDPSLRAPRDTPPPDGTSAPTTPEPEPKEPPPPPPPAP